MSGAPVAMVAETSGGASEGAANDRPAVVKFLQALPSMERLEDCLVDDITELIQHYRQNPGKRRRIASDKSNKMIETILFTHWKLIYKFLGLSPDLVNVMQTCKQWRAISLPMVKVRDILVLVGNPRKFDATQNVQYFDMLRREWMPFIRFHPDWVRGRIKAKLSAVYSKDHGLYIPSDHLRWNSEQRMWKPVKNIQCDSMVFIDNDIYSYQCFDNWGSELYLEITKRQADEHLSPIKRIVRELDPISAPYRVSQYQGACLVTPMRNGSSKIGFFGGSTFISKTSCCLLDPDSETWTDLPDLPIRIFNNTGTFWNGCVVIAGGSRTAGRWAFNSKVWMLDVSKPGATWTPLPEMPREHGHCMVATFNGDLVALMSTSATKPAVLYRYSPADYTWVQLWNEVNASANSNVSKDGFLLSCPYSVLFPDRPTERWADPSSHRVSIADSEPLDRTHRSMTDRQATLSSIGTLIDKLEQTACRHRLPLLPTTVQILNAFRERVSDIVDHARQGGMGEPSPASAGSQQRDSNRTDAARNTVALNDFDFETPGSAFKPSSSENIAAEIVKLDSPPVLGEDAQFEALLAKESTCLRCSRVDMDSILVLESCDHRFCRDCLRSVLLDDKSDYQSRTTCPDIGCQTIIPACICRKILHPFEYQALEDASIEAVLCSSAYIRCPSCNERFEKQPGKILGPEQDAVRSLDGSRMSWAGLKHRALHRFRCHCGVDFCDSCGSNPYHNGFNCESYKAYSASQFCRFCHAVIGRQILPKFGLLTFMLSRLLTLGVRSSPVADVCGNADCIAKSNEICTKVLPCSHPCSGIARESKCLRCLKCPDKDNNVVSEEFCNICWVESLGSAPCIELECGHIFHSACMRKKLENRWPGSRISFGFLSCPLCQKTVAHSSVNAIIRTHQKLRKDVTALAVKRLRVEQLTEHEKITSPSSRYFRKPEAFALDTFAFYQCFKCQKPYFGGKRECGDMVGLNAEQFDASELLCAKCAGSPSSCSKHGPNYIEYKCRYCCHVAVWFCWGNTHFCDKCHGLRPTTFPACPGPTRCPLGVDHPPNGKEFSLGCALCRRGRERPEPPPSASPPVRTRPRRDVIDLSKDERPRRPRLQERREIIELE